MKVGFQRCLEKKQEIVNNVKNAKIVTRKYSLATWFILRLIFQSIYYKFIALKTEVLLQVLIIIKKCFRKMQRKAF